MDLRSAVGELPTDYAVSPADVPAALGYLWSSPAQPGQPPAFEFAMPPELQRYAPELGAEDRLLGSQSDLVVGQWLSELSVGLVGETEAEEALRSAGVMAALQGAAISLDAAA